jgi:hypothetical protein
MALVMLSPKSLYQTRPIALVLAPQRELDALRVALGLEHLDLGGDLDRADALVICFVGEQILRQDQEVVLAGLSTLCPAAADTRVSKAGLRAPSSRATGARRPCGSSTQLWLRSAALRIATCEAGRILSKSMSL